MSHFANQQRHGRGHDTAQRRHHVFSGVVGTIATVFVFVKKCHRRLIVVTTDFIFVVIGFVHCDQLLFGGHGVQRNAGIVVRQLGADLTRKKNVHIQSIWGEMKHTF